MGGAYPNLPTQLQTQQMIYNPPAPPTTFLLPESVTHNIPDEVSDKFMKDKDGKLLWFSMPPLDVDAANKSKVGHSAAWFADRKEREERRRKREIERNEEIAAKKRRIGEERDKEKKEAQVVLARALEIMADQMAS